MMLFNPFKFNLIRVWLCSLILLAPFFSHLAQAQPALKRIQSNAQVIRFQVGKDGPIKNWALSPETRPDVLVVPLLNGIAQPIKFITPQETVEFTVEAGKSIDFIIMLEGKECLTRLVGTAYTPPTTLELSIDYTFAKMAAQWVKDGALDARSLAEFKVLPTTGAMIRKMRLKNFEQLQEYFSAQSKKPEQREHATLALAELAKNQGGKYSGLEAEVRRSLREGAR